MPFSRSYRFPLRFVFVICSTAVVCGCHHAPAAPQGNVLRYALQTEPTYLDPARVEDGDTIDMLMQVFEGLVQWSTENKIVPNLASSWDISQDGRVYTFHLVHNARFHNGRPVVAPDFVYSFTRSLDPAVKSATAATYMSDIVGANELNQGKAHSLSGVKALDDHTLQVTIDKPRPYFIAKLTYPTAYVVCREAVEKNGGELNERAMIGTGPFKLAEYRSGYRITLVANSDYHGGAPKLAGIERPILTDSLSRENEFESGGTDFTDVPRADIARINGDPKLGPMLKQFTRANIWYLGLNQLVFAPFKDVRVRQAFAHAIDRAELIRVALNGAAQPAAGILPPGVPGYDSAFPGLGYNPSLSRQLLAEAGYPFGKGFPHLTISFRQGYQFIADAVLVIRSDLKKNLGIDVDTRQVEWGQFLKQNDDRAIACAHLRWSADYLDPQDFLSLMLHTGAVENKVGYSNPKFDALCDAADVERDAGRRTSLYHQAEQIVVNDAPWVCLYHLPDIELHRPYVHSLRDCLMGHLPEVSATLTR